MKSSNTILFTLFLCGAVMPLSLKAATSTNGPNPRVAISTPGEDTRTTNSVIRGFATGKAQVTEVDYWLTNYNNGTTVVTGQATLDSGTTNRTWTIPSTPLAGTNIVAVQSVDQAGNKSIFHSRHFFFKSPSPFLLTQTGQGTVSGSASIHRDTPPTNGAMLNIGESYTLIAKPARHWSFTDWTSGSTIMGTNPTLRFTMENATSLQANFETNNFTQLVGKTYSGLFFDPTNIVQNRSGLIDGLTINSDGSFSGQLAMCGAHYKFAGVFDRNGQATAVANPPSVRGILVLPIAFGQMTVSLDLGNVWSTNAPFHSIQGSVAVASGFYVPPGNPHPNYVIMVDGWTNRLNLVASTMNMTSKEYTLLLPPSTDIANLSLGTGYAVITNHAGMLTINGALADGTPFSQTVPVNEDGFAPLYANLGWYSGALLGWIHVDTNVSSALNLDGTSPYGTNLFWVKTQALGAVPGGFTTALAPSLSTWKNQPFSPPLRHSQLELTWGTNSLSFANLAFNTNNDLTGQTAEGLKLRGLYCPKIGLLKLTSIQTGQGSQTSSGVVALIQGTNVPDGFGFFINSTTAGSVVLKSKPVVVVPAR